MNYYFYPDGSYSWKRELLITNEYISSDNIMIQQGDNGVLFKIPEAQWVYEHLGKLIEIWKNKK